MGAGGPCPGGPVRNSGGPPPAPGGGYSPATATAAAMPAKLAGSRPVRNRLRTALRGDLVSARPSPKPAVIIIAGAYLLDSRFIIITRDSGTRLSGPRLSVETACFLLQVFFIRYRNKSPDRQNGGILHRNPTASRRRYKERSIKDLRNRRKFDTFREVFPRRLYLPQDLFPALA